LVSFIFCYLRELGRTGEPGRAAESGASARTVPPALVRDNQGVTTGESDATSFGSVAQDYDRVRPGPAPAALDWLVPAGCQVAVDLAAGTGLFTRALAARVPRVVAVEPDRRMREVLGRRTPGLEVLAGQGESMPLPDASADAVFVSTAWHWLDPVRAVPEIARVLRPGGRLGIIWTSRNRDEDWVTDLDLLREGADRTAGNRARVRAYLDEHHRVTLPAGAPFTAGQRSSFRFTRLITFTDAVAWLGTSSDAIMASAADQAAARARCRELLLTRAVAGPGPSGTGPGAEPEPLVEMPLRSWCWRADRRLPDGCYAYYRR
jgi:SAM-dependent methyltransferase